MTASSWITSAEIAIANVTTHLLGFNEPDQPGQCNISVAAAVAGHKSFMNPLEGKALLGSPCITNNPSPKGITYLTNFLEECDSEWDVNVTIALAQKYGIDEGYVTKFGLTSATVDQKVAFVEEVLPWLDANPNVGGYAYFMDSDGNLLEGSELNALGTAYANA